MPILIDADATRKNILNLKMSQITRIKTLERFMMMEWCRAEMLKIINNAPTIDAEPVRHGRWVHSKKHLWYKNKDGEVDNWQLDCGYHNGPRCEVCGESFCEHCDPDWAEYECEIGHYVCSVCGQPTKTGDMNYCPHCGAKMDGGADNA